MCWICQQKRWRITSTTVYGVRFGRDGSAGGKPEVRELQSNVIKGRAIKVWNTTTPASRRAYFEDASGVGYKAGSEIEQSPDATPIANVCRRGRLIVDKIRDAAEHAAVAAGILYAIGPFGPDFMVTDLPGLLEHWLSGAPLSECTQDDAVAFIHDHIVYSLSWAIEAATASPLLHLRGEDFGAAGGRAGRCALLTAFLA